MHARDVGERVAPEGALDRAVVLGLELVVELLGDPLAQLAVERLDVEVKSIVERTWPTFIAAPRIWPSCLTSSRASAAARSPVASSACSGERTRLAARVPAQRADCPATSPPRRAERPIRLEGGVSAIV
jgi:hypothetical protein